MIRLKIEIEDTPERDITSVRAERETELSTATDREKVVYHLLRQMLANGPSVIGHGMGDSQQESHEQAMKESEIIRAIIAAGQPMPRGAEKEQ